MTTAAAIDRLVHHATIVEMVGESVRAEEAAERVGANGKRRVKRAPADNKETPRTNKKKGTTGTTTTKKRANKPKEPTTTGEM